MTYREIHAVLEAHNKRLRHDHRIAVITGYHAGALSVPSKKPKPKLADLLKPWEEPKPKKPPMSPRALRAAIFAANRAMGGKVIYKPKAQAAEG